MTFATDLFEPRRTRALRWTIAAVLVVVAHIGCTALALMHWQEDDAEDSPAGPIIVEMVAPPVATPQDMPDVAHGPLMEEAQASPQAAKETKVEVEKETPEVEPSPAPEPEVVLPVPKPVVEKKPEEEEQPKQEVAEQQSAQLANPAPLTKAPPRVEAKEAPVAPAASPGTTVASARNTVTWERSIVSHLNRFKRYPDGARARGTQGSVAVAFSIDRSGNVLDVRIVQTSGSTHLDEEALAVVKRASPIPSPPAGLPGSKLDLTLPIQFRIR
jgi:protein TonB